MLVVDSASRVVGGGGLPLPIPTAQAFIVSQDLLSGCRRVVGLSVNRRARLLGFLGTRFVRWTKQG